MRCEASSAARVAVVIWPSPMSRITRSRRSSLASRMNTTSTAENAARPKTSVAGPSTTVSRLNQAGRDGARTTSAGAPVCFSGWAPNTAS